MVASQALDGLDALGRRRFRELSPSAA